MPYNPGYIGLGATIGSAIPGVGTAIGAGAGALLGLFGGKGKFSDTPEYQQAAQWASAYNTAKPKTFGKIKDWTKDPSQGDIYSSYKREGWFPVWGDQDAGGTDEYQSTEDRAKARELELSDPNSGYYKKINQQIRSQLTGASGLNSLLGLYAAMGGSPTQARTQMEAMQGRIGAQAGDLTNSLYLNASGQANSINSNLLNYQQGNQQLAQNAYQYGQTRTDSYNNQLLGAGYSMFGNWLGGGGLNDLFKNTNISGGQPTSGGTGFFRMK